jgi:hypothetical protein
MKHFFSCFAAVFSLFLDVGEIINLICACSLNNYTSIYPASSFLFLGETLK